ncbi:DUF302 domain-containing protein [Pseudonocardia sp. GCM10023141]|uniref:DUF302 domain-containing protein n=1 Tax=Pseudonocardia sp. GCM10023141 TaxID=3252653 RepID=UPI003608ACDF
MDGTGLVTVASRWSVSETLDRLQAAAIDAGMVVFARIDHGGGAADVGLALRPTELLIFGNPRGGTALMQDQQTSGIDLPLKALAWQAADDAVWLTYNDTTWIAERHRLGSGSEKAVHAVATGLAQLVERSVGPA